VLPIAYALTQAKYNILLANMDRPENAPYSLRYGIRRLPHYTIYRGHEAVESTEGLAGERELGLWYHRAFRREESGGRFLRDQSQAFLGPADRVFLQRRISPGSCGMLGCGAHGGGVVTEYATQPTRAECPGGVCPRGG
jgi:hypothetical protein